MVENCGKQVDQLSKNKKKKNDRKQVENMWISAVKKLKKICGSTKVKIKWQKMIENMRINKSKNNKVENYGKQVDQ